MSLTTSGTAESLPLRGESIGGAGDIFPAGPLFQPGGWVGTGSVYGSLHIYVTALLARIAGDGVAANLLLFRGFFISLNLVNLVLIWKIASRIKPGLERKALVFTAGTRSS